MADPSPISLHRLHARPLKELERECEEVATAKPGDTHRIASLMQQMSLHYYADVRKQAQQSFRSALVAAAISTFFFLFAAWYGMKKNQNAWIGVVAGALTQVISAISFYLYGRAAHQFATFHICLERTNRYLLANTLCENLELPLKDRVRHELIGVISNAPMLTLNIMEGSQGGKAEGGNQEGPITTEKGDARDGREA